MGELVSKDKGMIKEELLKVSEGRADRDERIKEDFWEKLEKSVSAAPGSPVDKRLAELQTKRSEITELIEYSKKKYIKHELDEESFKGIVRDYHKELIEIENQIKRLGGETA
jgi:hypothetical protein